MLQIRFELSHGHFKAFRSIAFQRRTAKLGKGDSALHGGSLHPGFHACQSVYLAAARTVVWLLQDLDGINFFDGKLHDMVRDVFLCVEKA